MLVKVCGVKTESNIRDLAELAIDMVGLNFYPTSKRYVDASVIPQWYDELPDAVSRVGVFVNADLDDILDLVDEYRLDMVQLHGDEDVKFTNKIARQIPTIKAIKVSGPDTIATAHHFEYVDYILFDKASPSHGGSGQKFDWAHLQEYNMDIPFLLSGGIGPLDINLHAKIDHPMFIGVDINSKFELAPGIKDTGLIASFVKVLK